MNLIELAELRLWLNRNDRRDWLIRPIAEGEPQRRSATIVSSPDDHIRIGLYKSNAQWVASLLMPYDPSNRTYAYTSQSVAIRDDTPATAVRKIIATENQWRHATDHN